MARIETCVDPSDRVTMAKAAAALRSRADADDVGARERVPEHGLEAHAAEPEAEADEDGEDRAREAEAADGEGRAGHLLSGDHAKDLGRRVDGLADEQRDGERGDDQEREDEHDDAAAGAPATAAGRDGQGGRAGAGAVTARAPSAGGRSR